MKNVTPNTLTPKSTIRRTIGIIIGCILVVIARLLFWLYPIILAPNTAFSENKKTLYIRTGATMEQLVTQLQSEKIVQNIDNFKWVSNKMNFQNVKPGKYEIKKESNTREIVGLLRAGRQTPITITFNGGRTLTDVTRFFGKKLECDSLDLLQKLQDNSYLQKFHLSKEEAPLLFIPNTYEMYWNTDADKLLAKMNTEYTAFWNTERKQKAAALGLSSKQVGVLASIVQSETAKEDEKPIVAGVYLNRLKKDMKLQADPTVIFALQDFTIRRVLKKMLDTDSPYNTYKYNGLPPGPICVSSTKSIDAVLNYKAHSYLFFCAKEDFSGYHNFATTNAEHEKNAKVYQKALTEYMKAKKLKEKQAKEAAL